MINPKKEKKYAFFEKQILVYPRVCHRINHLWLNGIWIHIEVEDIQRMDQEIREKFLPKILWKILWIHIKGVIGPQKKYLF